MSTSRSSAGLGLDLGDGSDTGGTVLSGAIAPSTTSSHATSTRSSTVRFRANEGNPHKKNGTNTALCAEAIQDAGALGMRSMRSMRGLLLAEVGASMVEFNTPNSGSGFREGLRIAPEVLTPGGGTRVQRSRHLSLNEGRLTRQPTLLSVGCSPATNAAELKYLLGNSNTKLKAKAKLGPSPGSASTLGSTSDGPKIYLEQAKARARVELDIILSNDTCVQGGVLKGQVNLCIRKRSKKEAPILLSDVKLRIVGFECIQNRDGRHIFYQYAVALNAVAPALSPIYVSGPDTEGYMEAKEGLHRVPFAVTLPIESEYGSPKGVLTLPSGVAVRYIVMSSARVKDTKSGKQSIAHFYRQCEIWPRLDPSAILLSAPRPIQSTIAAPLFMGGSGRVKLNAVLHRLHWVSGQRCYATINISNNSKKTIRSVTLALIRTTTIFKPNPALDANPRYSDPDACQTSTIRKEVATSTLEMGQQSSKGHASAKGWWTGVGPNTHLEFQHFIQIPPDAVTVMRGRLLEVEYTLRVSASAGSLTSDIQVIVPLRIVNFMSIDPPPSSYAPSNISDSSAVSRRSSGVAQLVPDLGKGVIDYSFYAESNSEADRNVPRDTATQHDDPSSATMSDSSGPSRLQNPHSLISTRSNTEDGIGEEQEMPEGELDGPESLMDQVEAELGNMRLFHASLGDNDDDEMVRSVVGSARLDVNDNGVFDPVPFSLTPQLTLGLPPEPVRFYHRREPTEGGQVDMADTQGEHVHAVSRTRSKTVSEIPRPAYGARNPSSFAEQVQVKLLSTRLAESADMSMSSRAGSTSTNLSRDPTIEPPADTHNHEEDQSDAMRSHAREDITHLRRCLPASQHGVGHHTHYASEEALAGRASLGKGAAVSASQSSPALTVPRPVARDKPNGDCVGRPTAFRATAGTKGGSSVRARIAELERRTNGLHQA